MPQSTLDRDRLERLVAVTRGLLSERTLDVLLDRVLEAARELAAMGSWGMRERVELGGGELRIASGPTGTAVNARVPVPTSGGA